MQRTAVRLFPAVLALFAIACGGEEAPIPHPSPEDVIMNIPRPTTAAPAALSIQYTADGTPIFPQSFPTWTSRIMSGTTTIKVGGGALCSVAMAMSKIVGAQKNPASLDVYLDLNAGYENTPAGPVIRWNVAAAMAGLSAQQVAFSLEDVDVKLAAGLPVAVGVSTDGGITPAGPVGTWVAVTSKGLDDAGELYNAVDPATAEAIVLRPVDGKLTGGPRRYTTTTELVVFSAP